MSGSSQAGCKHLSLDLLRWVAKFRCQFPCHVMVCDGPAHPVS